MKLSNLFKKKEEKPIDKPKEALYLGLWCLFLVGVVIYVRVGSTKKDVTSVEEKYSFINVADGIKELQSNNYEYNYSITGSDNNIYYAGSRNSELSIGVRIEGGNGINYYVDNSGTYNRDTKKLITGIYDEFDDNLFDSEKMYGLVKNMDGSFSDNSNVRTYTYNGKYKDNDISIELKVNDKNIFEINYSYSGVNYKMSYTNVGSVGDLSIE